MERNNPIMRKTEVYPDPAAMAQAAAARFTAAARQAIAARGQFTVALSGGNTPRRLYELLAAEPFVSEVAWPAMHIFWGDERAVPPDDPASNYRLAAETLLRRVPVPPPQVHRIRAELPPEEAAADYECTLRDFFAHTEHGGATFDLVLLGLGQDGHTASLFPRAAAIRERERWAVAYRVPDLGAWRITLTPPVLNAARQVLFLVSGADKAEAVRQVLRGPYRPDELPAQVIQPVAGDVHWLLDVAAAALL